MFKILKTKPLKFLFSLVLLNFLSAETFAERFESLDFTPEAIFYVPKADTAEYSYYQAGQMRSWLRYSKETKPQNALYTGYVLFADPFHEAQKKISFLLGSDCSTFTHRFYQLLGADYPITKTRHFIAYGKASAKPESIGVCMWENLKKSFQHVDKTNIHVGDLVVYGTTSDEYGERGHMGMVASLNPFAVLQAKYKKGYFQEELNLEEFVSEKKPYFFRYKKELRELPSRNLNELLSLTYPFNNSGCESIGP